MRGKLMKNGHYELFETTTGHQILNLDDKEYYAIVEGQQGDILEHASREQKKKQTKEEGTFYLARFENDPQLLDIPHLFLESSEMYREFLLPHGLPTANDHQKQLIRTEEKIERVEEKMTM